MTAPRQICFIGAGNMANALIAGVLRAGLYPPGRIVASDSRPEARDALHHAHGVRTSADNAAAVADAQVVVLSVKPQVFPSLLPTLAPAIHGDQLIISIMAGVRLATIEAGLGVAARVVRAMPNTPALVGAGATALAPGALASATDMDTAEAVFDAVGLTERVEEHLLDAVTALSGSGPAYVFRMVEALVEGAEGVGLPRDQALRLATQTVYGAAKLLSESDDGPQLLRQRVTSPGGTTAAGLQALEDAGFAAAVVACIEAATARGKALGASED